MTPVALYTPCEACAGHGCVRQRLEGERTVLCPACGGIGFVPTAEGRTIIGLIQVAGQRELLPG